MDEDGKCEPCGAPVGLQALAGSCELLEAGVPHVGSCRQPQPHEQPAWPSLDDAPPGKQALAGVLPPGLSFFAGHGCRPFRV